MGTIGASILLLSLVAAQDKPAPKFAIGKETTYVTGPVDKDGYIDFETALNGYLGKGITPERNANILIWRALGPTPGDTGKPADYFKLLGTDEPPKKGEYFVDLKSFLKSRFNIEGDEYEKIQIQGAWARERPWSTKDYPHLAEWLKANEKPLALMIEASRRTEYFNPIVSREPDGKRGLMIGALLPSVQKCRAVAFALVVRAMLRVQEGMTDEAWQDLLACHRLGRLITRGADPIEVLAGIAIDGAANGVASQPDIVFLACAKLSSLQINQCLKDLRGLPPLPIIADKIDIGARFVFLDSMQSVIRESGKAVFKSSGGSNAKELNAEQRKAMEMIDWTPTLRDGNRWFDRIVAATRLADRARREMEFEQIDKNLEAMKKERAHPASIEELTKLIESDQPPYKKLGAAVCKSIGNACIGMMMPNCHKLRQVQDRIEQLQRNLHIAFALAAYHADRGRYPSKLSDLAPKFLATIPEDLFSGQALIYRPSENGYLLYSIGQNGQDDGGRNTGDNPPGDDLAIRMPLPELKPSVR